MFWDDLRGEERLKLVSLAAQGLWTVHMLPLMAGAGGYLAFEGDPLSVSDLAALVGKPLAEVQAAFDELDAKVVFSRDRHGTPYNRRMVKGAKKARSSAANGKGGGRPRQDVEKPVDNSEGSASVPRTSRKGAKSAQYAGVSKSLNGHDNSDLQTYSEPIDNLRGQPRARTLTLLTQDKDLIHRGEKNPASANGTAGRGRNNQLNGGKTIARILGTQQWPDTPENRKRAMLVLMALPQDEAHELEMYGTPIARVTELIGKGIIAIDG